MSETTMIIRRRLKHWKTSITGIALMLSPVAYAIWPNHGEIITKVVLSLTGAGFIAAADGAVSDRNSGPAGAIAKSAETVFHRR